MLSEFKMHIKRHARTMAAREKAWRRARRGRQDSGIRVDYNHHDPIPTGSMTPGTMKVYAPKESFFGKVCRFFQKRRG